MQVSGFRLLIRLFTTTTSFQRTVTTLSLHNQISTFTTTSLQLLKSLLPPKIVILCYFILNSTRNKFNKLQPLSYQFTSHITPRLQFTRLNQSLKYATLLHYSHIRNTHKTTPHTPSTSTPKYTLLKRLVTCKSGTGRALMFKDRSTWIHM